VRAAQHDGDPGFGKGLAICREIVERHGGTITVASQGEGTGTSVVIDLPFARPGVPIE
jgi:signal transduction histidine kinase